MLVNAADHFRAGQLGFGRVRLGQDVLVLGMFRVLFGSCPGPSPCSQHCGGPFHVFNFTCLTLTSP